MTSDSNAVGIIECYTLQVPDAFNPSFACKPVLARAIAVTPSEQRAHDTLTSQS